TQYGDPQTSLPIVGYRTLDISIDPQDCKQDGYGNLAYVLPVRDKDEPASTNEWVRTYGFVVPGVLEKNFPTIGFRGAQFELVNKKGAPRSSEYTWTTDHPEVLHFEVSKSSKNQMVIFIG